jgi:hypothetical protein
MIEAIRRARILVATALLLGVGCAGKMNVIGPPGGTFVSADGKLTLVFPPGALDASTEISATPRAVPAEAGFVGNLVYDLSPDGATFRRPVSITLAYDPRAVHGPESSLRIAKLVSGGVGLFADSPQVDTSVHTVTAMLDGFSSWGVTSCHDGGCLQADANPDRTITVTWWPWRAPVERAICHPDSNLGESCLEWGDGRHDDQFNFAVPTSGRWTDCGYGITCTGPGVYWYRIAIDGCHGPSQPPCVYYAAAAIAPEVQPPPQAQSFTATPQADGSIVLSWGVVDTASSYVLRREACGAVVDLTEVSADGCGPTTCSFTDTRGLGLLPEATYRYHLLTHNTAGTGPDAVASATSMRQPLECAVAGFHLANCDIALPANGQVSIDAGLVWRQNETVQLSLVPSPADQVPFTTYVGTTFNPQTVSAPGASTITFRDSGAGGSGRVSATLLATALDGVNSCATPISIHFAGASSEVPITLSTFQDVNAANAEWVAARAGDQPWQALTGSGGHYSFTALSANGGRYSVAVACKGRVDRTQYAVQLLELTTADTTSPAVACDEASARVSVTLNPLRFPPGDTVQGILWAYELSPPTTSSWTTTVPPGIYDVALVTSGPNGPDSVLVAPMNTIVGLNPTIDLDLGNSIATQNQLVASIQPGTYPSSSGSVFLHTPLNTVLPLGASSTSSHSFDFSAVPLASLGNSIHELQATASSPTQTETFSIFFTTPANVFADFSTPLVFAPTVTMAATTPYARPQATFAAVAGAAGYTFEYEFRISSTAVDSRWDWNAFVSSAWLAGVGGSPSYSLPDLSPASGFPSAYGINNLGVPINWTATVHEVSNGTVDTLLQVLAQRTGSVHSGFTHRASAASQAVH